MPKLPLNPGDVDGKYRELIECVPIGVAALDEVPAAEGGVYCFYWKGPAGDPDPLDYQVIADKTKSRVNLDVM